MDGEVKLNESSVVLVQIPYKEVEAGEEDNYRAYGKVSNFNFLSNGKMRVKIDIGVRSAKDFNDE
jgi:hypothetical protein